MGDVTPIEDSFVQKSIPDEKGGEVSGVKVLYIMSHPVENDIYEYLTNKAEAEANDNINNSILDKTKKELKINPFKILPFEDVKPFQNSIPLYDIKAAAGDFTDLQINEETKWIELMKPFKYSEDYFVCKVIGESMNKKIPNDSWCLFKKDSGGSRNGKIVLVHQHNIQDADFGKGFTVKSYESKKNVNQDEWHHEIITLKPLSFNTEYKDLVLNEDELTDFKVIGVFVEVLT